MQHPNERGAVARMTLATLLAAVIAAGCGGGNGGSSSPAGEQNGSGTGTAAATGAASAASAVVGTGAAAGGSVGTTAGASTFVVADKPATAAEASRFLAQATFGPKSSAEIDRLMQIGYGAWFDEQFAMRRVKSYRQWMVDAEADPAAKKFLDDENSEQISAWYSQAVLDPDQLRQRMAWALSQITVVSGIAPGVNQSPYYTLMGGYGDRIADNALGNYRTLLDRVTRSQHMGIMLTFLGNERENYNAAGQVPDQNYAREVMQLFTIGLWQLNPDGTRKKDGSGQDIPTYTTADIEGLSRVFTGMGGTADLHEDTQIDENRHSCVEKKFLGRTIDAGRTAPPPEDGKPAGDCRNANGKTLAEVSLALDTLFNHANIGPFIGRQLIQRFTTSNPSSAYVQRVAQKFNDNGGGVRGDLKAVIKQVLLDPEARDPAKLKQPDWGKVREPVLRSVQMMRVLGHKFSDGRVWSQLASGNCYTVHGVTSGVDQIPYHAPNVFNFYRPGFSPPGTRAAAAAFVAPEMQTFDTLSLGVWSRYVADSLSRDGTGLSWNGIPGRAINNSNCPTPNPTFDYAGLTPVASDVDALVDRVDLLLTGSTLSVATRGSMKAAVAGVSGSGDTQRKNRVKVALQLALMSPQYLVQK